MTTSVELRVLAQLRAFLEENFLYMRPDFVLRDQDRLLGSGGMDSMGVLEMLNFIEDEFGVRAEDDEVSEANLGTLQAVARFVAGKLDVAGAA